MTLEEWLRKMVEDGGDTTIITFRVQPQTYAMILTLMAVDRESVDFVVVGNTLYKVTGD